MPDKKSFDIIQGKISKLAEKRRAILMMEPEKALNVIIEEPQPLPLVHSIPDEDFFLLMHEAGVHDFLPVLEMASLRQWEYIIDMEIWNRDSVSVDSMTRWFDILMKADAPRLLRWLMDEKIEMTEYYLSKNIELRVREHDEDPSDFGDGFSTFDDVFYFRIKPMDFYGGDISEETVEDRDLLIESMLKGFASLDHHKFQGMLFESAAVIFSEAEEELYRWRTVRLTEKGFMAFDEAAGAYQPLAAWETPETGRRLNSGIFDNHGHVFAIYPAIMASECAAFRDLPVSLQDIELPDDFGNEIAALCNRIIVADHKTVRSKDGLHQIVEKVSGCISLGMTKISELTGLNRESLISEFNLLYLFRAGYSRITKLQADVRSWIEMSWFKSEGIHLGFWGEEWMGMLGGLLLKRPLFFCNYERGLLYRDFRCEDDFLKAKQDIDYVMMLDAIFMRMAEPVPEIPAGVFQAVPFMLTMWANSWLERKNRKFVITIEEFSLFYNALFENSRHDHGINLIMKENFIEWLSLKTGVEAPDLYERAWPVFELVFRNLDAEYRSVDVSDLDSRFMDYFYIV